MTEYKTDILEIKLSRDGDMCCALVGQNLQVGIAGFAERPIDAIRNLCDEIEKSAWTLQNTTL